MTQAQAQAQVTRSADLIHGQLTDEDWREYDFQGRTYRIINPVEFMCRPGGETHRVVDSKGIVHCVPAPGRCGCVLRWKSKNSDVPVAY